MEKSTIHEIFSTGFARWMGRNGYKLHDVALKLGVSDVSVSLIRSGKTIPTFEKVFTLVELGMTLDEIFGKELAGRLSPMKDRPKETLEQQLEKLKTELKSLRDKIDKVDKILNH